MKDSKTLKEVEKNHIEKNPLYYVLLWDYKPGVRRVRKLEGIQVKNNGMKGTLKFIMSKDRLGWLACSTRRGENYGQGYQIPFFFTAWWKENGGNRDSPFWKMHSERTSWNNHNLCWRLFQLDRRKLFHLQRSSVLEQDPWEAGWALSSLRDFQTLLNETPRNMIYLQSQTFSDHDTGLDTSRCLRAWVGLNDLKRLFQLVILWFFEGDPSCLNHSMWLIYH